MITDVRGRHIESLTGPLSRTLRSKVLLARGPAALSSVSLRRVVIVGSGGHARVVVDILEREGASEIAGFLDSIAQAGSKRHGYQVVGRPEDIAGLVEQFAIAAGFVAIGDNWTRGLITEAIKAAVPGLPLVAAVHPSAVIGRDVEVGAGSAAMAGAVINPGSRIGFGSVINTQASVDHDCSLGSFASIAPGATLSGGVHVGAYAVVGPGACVLETVRIGEHAVIGAGSVVTRDVPPRVIAYGNPARIIRDRKPGETYLRTRSQ